ncbi:hypothetical protein X744_21690 [Mesorhizobium sp. LNJC372A00]|nr:hypothetical protein X745_23295 [Mesorhizobium sp. LNJC374B00]ESY56852.1 hypothetical protein X744_21690 [Mesorhizobium sp. LNJC372A00]
MAGNGRQRKKTVCSFLEIPQLVTSSTTKRMKFLFEQKKRQSALFSKAFPFALKQTRGHHLSDATSLSTENP